jgi:hypothetical protein
MELNLEEQYAWVDDLLRYKYYYEYCMDLEEQYAWVDDLLRYKYYSEYCLDLDNAEDWNDSFHSQGEDDDDEEQDSRLLARKMARHYPLSEIDADIWQAINEPQIYCGCCQQSIPESQSLRHELLCLPPQPQVINSIKSSNGLYCYYCDIQFDCVHEYVHHDSHCLGYNWQATLEEGLYYENTLNSAQVHPMDLEFEVGNMEWK